MARLAEIECGAVQESRELILRSLQNEHEAFSSALNRSSRLTSSGDVLAGTVAEMTSALRTQFDDVIEALRALRVVGGEWPEMDSVPGDAEPEHPYAAHPEPEPLDPQEQAVVALSEAEAELLAAPDTRRAEGEPPPERAANAAEPNPRVGFSPELTEMFRQHITRMHDDGKPREEAERALLRFKLGHRFVEMLDEVYSSDAASADAGRRG